MTKKKVQPKPKTTGLPRNLKKKTPPPARVPPNITLEIPKDFPKDWGKVDGQPFGFPSGVGWSGITGSKFKSPQEFGAAFESLKRRGAISKLHVRSKYMVSQRVSKDKMIYLFIDANAVQSAYDHYLKFRECVYPSVNFKNNRYKTIDVVLIGDGSTFGDNPILLDNYTKSYYAEPWWYKFSNFVPFCFWNFLPMDKNSESSKEKLDKAVAL